MLVSTRTTLALRCAQCGRLDVHDLSLFAFSGSRSVRSYCSCGAAKLTIGTKGNQFWLQFPCLLCDSTHFLYFSRTEFWSPDVKPIACPETGLDVGFFGQEMGQGSALRAGEALSLGALEGGARAEGALSGGGLFGSDRDLIGEAVGGGVLPPRGPFRTADEIMDEAGFDDYFDNPPVMYGLLSGLQRLAESLRLRCACGNRHVQVDILPDRLELTCPACGRWRRLSAERDGDLAQVGELAAAIQSEDGWLDADLRPRI